MTLNRRRPRWIVLGLVLAAAALATSGASAARARGHDDDVKWDRVALSRSVVTDGSVASRGGLAIAPVHAASPRRRLELARKPPMAQTDAAYDDTLGDAQLGVPDLARVAVVNDASGVIGIGLRYANRACATTSDLTFVDLDTDQNPATGNGLGIDYVLFVDIPGNRRGVARWDGAAFQPIVVSSLQAGCDPQGFDYWFFDRSELGIDAGFNFYASACTDASRSQCGDTAPNALPLWNYQLTSTAPTPQPPPPTPQPPTPQPPTPPPAPTRTVEDAPFLPKRTRYTGSSIRHAQAASAIYSTMKVVGGGKQLQVACWSVTDWRSVVEDLGGDVSNGRTVMMGFWLRRQARFLHLSPRACTDYQALVSSHRINASRAYAATVALHETVHMYGIENEAQANCYAVQLVYYLARNLKFNTRQAAQLEKLAVRTTRASAPSGYWSQSRCHDGGTWDLDDEFSNLDY